jgi:prepilin-type N-terminal cleavage/methylation domain-containing protein
MTSNSSSSSIIHSIKCAGQSRGFTLIELLIVVAIIAILAAIAVPNFLEAQTRARISRAVADMRTLATGLELYTVDNAVAPPSQQAYYGNPFVPNFHDRLIKLTTPIAYLNIVYDDIFLHNHDTDPNNKSLLVKGFRPYMYARGDYTIFDPNFLQYKTKWIIAGGGPDNTLSQASYFPQKIFDSNAAHFSRYDATNGTLSRGDLYRFGGDSPEVVK